MEKIGIFCSASENIDKMYFESARRIGEWIGQTGKTLIYGGANLGLMECVARTVKENGGKVIGVVPTKLEENGRVSSLLDEVIHTRNLSDRKDVITDVEPCVFIHYSGANIREKSLLECLKQPLFMAYRDNQPFIRVISRPLLRIFPIFCIAFSNPVIVGISTSINRSVVLR